MTGSWKAVQIFLLRLGPSLFSLSLCAQIVLPADRTVEFNRDVRPILSDKCLHCHGTDATAKGIPLRLDSEAAATADLGEGRRAIVPGDTASSQIIHRITATDEALRMPPGYSDLKLTPGEIETLRVWIAQGAKWQVHWSFIPPRQHPLPSVKQVTWVPAGVPNDRLGFATWLIDPGNPLTARVTVNRFWQMFFGTGLVKTTEDFGLQGEWPSHPELLDWLATEFVHSGWDLKALQKLVVMSASYRQSSKATPELLRRDPENRHLAHGPRFRLRAEVVRDQALFAAGLLVEKTGGPSVKPYQPAGLWEELTMQGLNYEQSKAADLYRRSLYTFWKRTVAPPLMANFDSALRESCVVRETRTNTPLQALNLMNDITFLEAARFIGQRMLKEGGNDATSRLRYGFRLVAGRAALTEEEQILGENLQYHLEYFSSHTDKVERFLAQGESGADSKLSPTELAAYASVASLLLNSDEAVTKH